MEAENLADNKGPKTRGKALSAIKVCERFHTTHPASPALRVIAQLFIILGLFLAVILIFTVVMPEITITHGTLYPYETTERVFNPMGLGVTIGTLLSIGLAYFLLNRFADALDTAATTQVIVADIWATIHTED